MLGDDWRLRYAVQILTVFCFPPAVFGQASSRSLSPTKLLAHASTWVQPIFELSLFVLSFAAAILIVGFALLAYSFVNFRRQEAVAAVYDHRNDGSKPPRVDGSDQTGLAWIVIPILIVVALFSASDRRS